MQIVSKIESRRKDNSAISVDLPALLYHRHIFMLLLLFAGVTISPIATSKTSSVLSAAKQVDQLVNKDLTKAGLVRNAPISDETFARRIYLDIVGRIPRYDELMIFLNDKNKNKRSILISKLLDSEGYVSHFYNFWEDILRVQSRGRRTVMVEYQDWIKQALRENTPYDKFVQQLITADGFVWENPAVGYYLRDAGMPLDNMSNTAQIFLGTRMQCAQCHDHPFDKWTQKDYYHMAAYTSHIESSGRKYQQLPAFVDFRKNAAQKYASSKRTETKKKKKRKQRVRYKPSATERRAIREIFQPLAAEVRLNREPLRLPEDYQYDDAKPKQVIHPKTPFGPDALVAPNTDQRLAYAKWMTSAQNPRFTRVIANRLWKKVMGVGLIEPVDDIKDKTQASNEELLQYLAKMMTHWDYNPKQYLRMLFNTRTYQSQVYKSDIIPGEKYFFTGPALRRMTAEQLWDSVLTLGVANLDNKIGGDIRTMALRKKSASLQAHVENVEKLHPEQIYDIVKHISQLEAKAIKAEKELQLAIQNSNSKQEKVALKKEYQKARRNKNTLIEKALADAVGTNANYAKEFDMSMTTTMDNKRKKKRNKKTRKFEASLVRASEIISPAPPGHFLQQFGQSDRDLIESSSNEPAVPQALTLLNGNLINILARKDSVITGFISQAGNPTEMQDILFLSFYSRYPTEKERNLVSEHVEKYKRYRGYRDAMLALLNSQEFRFIQ